MSDSDPSTLIPAATVILVRARATVEVLMVKRDSKLAFAGGHWVFPGGRVDAADYPPNEVELDDLARLGAAEVAAAVREAAEEAGLVIEPTALRRWSHWTPPDAGQPRRFSTAFFIAPAPDGEVVVDDVEIRDHQWVSPERALVLQRAEQIELTPPTYITLTQLEGATTVDELLARADGVVEHFATRIGALEGELVALYHGDAGYVDGDAGRAGPRHRLRMAPGSWRYERDPSIAPGTPVTTG